IEGDTTYTGPITNDNNIVNKKYVDDAGDGLIAKGLNFTGNDNTAGAVHRDLGQTLAITGGATTTGDYEGANLKTVTNPDTGAIEIQMAKSPQFGDIVINDSSGNIDMGSHKITNLADGTDASDAATVGQINTAAAGSRTEVQGGTNIASVTKSTAGDGHDVYTVNADGASVSTDSNLTVTPTAVANNVTDYQISQADSITVGGAAPETIDGTAGTVSGLTNTTCDPNTTYTGGQAATQEQLSQVRGDALSWDPAADGGNGAYNANHEGSGPNKVINVANGEVNGSRTDAVNGSQLFDVKNTADSAMQSFTTAADGSVAQTIEDGDQANFTSGDNIELTASTSGIEVATAADVTFDNLTVNKTTKLGDHFTVNNDGSVTYDGPITNDTNIVNKKYVDNSTGDVVTQGLDFEGDDGVTVH